MTAPPHSQGVGLDDPVADFQMGRPIDVRRTVVLRASFDKVTSALLVPTEGESILFEHPELSVGKQSHRAEHHSGLHVIHDSANAVNKRFLSGRKEGHSNAIGTQKGVHHVRLQEGAVRRIRSHLDLPFGIRGFLLVPIRVRFYARLNTALPPGENGLHTFARIGMYIAFLVPDIHDRPTGGNIYNRRVITELQDSLSTEVIPWPSEGEQRPSIDLPGDAAIVLDSLLLRQTERVRALRVAHPTATLVLLAHYLHCIDPNEEDTLAAETERDVLSLFDGVVTPSRYGRQALRAEGVPASQIKIVPPGLDDAYRAPLSGRPSRDSPRLLTVANLLPGKGLRSLVEVLPSLTDAAWTWTLVGDETLDPDFAATLHEHITASSIADRVTCPGAVPTAALRTQYDRADVFVLPSRFETCSMATREAMARGLPILGYEVGGLPENLSDAAASDATAPSDAAAPSDATAPSDVPAGRLVSPDRPGALADALRVLLTDPTARERMGQAARECSRAFPTWAETADRFHAVLRALRAVADT